MCCCFGVSPPLSGLAPPSPLSATHHGESELILCRVQVQIRTNQRRNQSSTTEILRKKRKPAENVGKFRNIVPKNSENRGENITNSLNTGFSFQWLWHECNQTSKIATIQAFYFRPIFCGKMAACSNTNFNCVCVLPKTLDSHLRVSFRRKKNV